VAYLNTYALQIDRNTTKTSSHHTPFYLLYGQEAIIPVELELTFISLALQGEELNSTDIPQRIHALLDLEEQRIFSLENIKKRQHSIKKYFDKREKTTTFAINDFLFIMGFFSW
jgi:hypothetical protein